MRGHILFISYLLFALIFIASAQARQIEPKSERIVREARASSLRRAEFPPSEIQKRGLTKIKLQNGINLDLKKFLDSTRLSNTAELRSLFNRPDIQKSYLATPPQYTEKIIQLSDRLVVDRKAIIRLKPGISKRNNLPRVISKYYFHRKKGNIPPEVTKGITEIRRKLKKASPNRIVMQNITVAQARRMNDTDLLGLVLNDNERIIQHVSILPLQGFKIKPGKKLKNPKKLGLTNFSAKLTKKDLGLSVVTRENLVPREDLDLESRLRLMSSREIFESLSDVGTWEAHLCLLEMELFTQGKAERGDEWGDEWNAILLRIFSMSSDEDFSWRQVRYWPETRELLLRIKRTGQTACIDRFNERNEASRREQRERMENKSYSFDKNNFTTGFLYERSIENSYSYTFTEETWLTDEYYIEFSYDLGYTFEIRFPYSVKVDARPMSVTGSGDTEERNRRVDIRVNPLDLLGNEFTLKAWANAEFYASIPGSNVEEGFSKEVGGGKTFKPILGNRSEKNIGTLWLRGSDLMLGYTAWYGSVFLDIGATAKMKNGEIGYSIKPDNNSSFRRQPRDERHVWRANTGNYTFNLQPDNIDEGVGFKIYKPEYKFNISIMPSAQINLNLDLGVYEKNVIVGPFDFDSLSVDIGGWTLEIYEGTTASYDYSME